MKGERDGVLARLGAERARAARREILPRRPHAHAVAEAPDDDALDAAVDHLARPHSALAPVRLAAHVLRARDAAQMLKGNESLHASATV